MCDCTTVIADLASDAPGKGDAMIAVKQPYTGSSNRTQHDKNAEFVSATDFGPLGTSDDSAVLNAAFNSGCKNIYIPQGLTCLYGQPLTIPHGVRVHGAGSSTTSLISTFTTGDCITIGTNAELSNVYLGAVAPRTSGRTVVLAGNAATLRNFEMSQYFIGIYGAGSSGSSLIVAPRIAYGLMRSPSTGSGSAAIFIDNYSNADLSHLVITGPGSNQPDCGLKVGHGDTFFISNSNITAHGAALYIAPTTGQTSFSITATACFFDSAIGHCSAELHPAGGDIRNAKFVNCWFGLSDQSGLSMIASGENGVIDGMELASCEWHGCGDSGLRAHGAGVKNINIIGGSASGNTVAGINISGGMSDFTILGAQIGNISGRGANGIGVVVQSGVSNRYLITNNRINGNTTNLIDSGTGVNKIVSGNIL